MTGYRGILILGTALLLSGCEQSARSTPSPEASANKNATVLLSVTSDAAQDPQSIDMALKLAGFSLEEGRRVVIFFNVKGVNIPSSKFPDDLAFQVRF